MNKRFALKALVSSVALTCNAAMAVSGYTISDLGLLPNGHFLSANSLNDLGQVVGYGFTNGTNHAFLWSDGALNDLGALPGATSGAADINNAGLVVGSSGSLAVVWQGGSLSTLEVLSGATYGGANAVNESGQIVGSSGGGAVPYQAVIWNEGRISSLGAVPNAESSIAIDISDSGRVVGTLTDSLYRREGFTWIDGSFQRLGMLPGHTESGAIGVNNFGQIVGYSEVGNLSQAVMWNDESISLLAPVSGDLGGRAYEINDAGDAVGFSIAAGGTFRAALWQDESTYDLNSLLIDGDGWYLQQAVSINERGQITGWGSLGGLGHSFLLTPVPEPTSFLMLLTGLGLLAGRLKRLGAVT